MTNKPATPRSPARPTARAATLDAAFELFGRNPTATMADLAAHAGVGRATIHRQFASREALMVTLAETAIHEMNTAIEAAVADVQSHGEALRVMLDVLVPLGARHGFLWRERVEQDPGIAAAYAAEQAELRDEIKNAQAEGVFDPALPAAWIAEAYDAAVQAAWELVAAGEATPKQASDFAWRWLTHGCGGKG